MVGPTTVNLLLGNSWSLPPQSQFYLLLIGANVFIMGFILAEEEDPQPFIIAISVAILLLLLFWWLGWFYAAAAVMLPLTGVLWWLERRSKATGSLEQRR